ncbi:hypothetical protein PGT21_016214 [Puccinia graminis f. sp. tritici]|uniref:Uncharacterized protein n=1 Tax=Puccinia graminis f. sp. tritici TaxID=56615 RepID=A0A5B0NY90_PUCGR|nr:hypothetical protein PGT21_016214 [Puccinia graminis f. sp. tritici]KAA1093504.1 hypothetical protein PGTUg99_023409 [Puccinia graminis f. sp. tritici]
MTVYNFFFTVISVLLVYSSRCLGQQPNPCFANGQVSDYDCYQAFALMNFTTDNTILAGEKRIATASGGCLLEVLSKDTGATQRFQIYDAMLDVEKRCSPAMVGSLPYPSFIMTMSQIQPDTPVFGSNTKFDVPSCNIPSPFSPGIISPPDCLKAIDSIRINKASPQKLLAQSRGEISASFKSCSVYIKSSNQLDITLNQDKLKKMSSLITGKCKQLSGSVVKQFGSFGLNSRTQMQIYFNGKPL